MPASMISDAVGGRWKVIGSNMAMVATGPIPGSTPISVPTMQPKNAHSRFWKVMAVFRPIARLCSRSISATPEDRTNELEKAGKQIEQRVDPGTDRFKHDGADIGASDIEDADIHPQSDPEHEDREQGQHGHVADHLEEVEFLAAERRDQ